MPKSGERARPDAVVAKIIVERTGACVDYLPNPRNEAGLPAVPTAQAGENDPYAPFTRNGRATTRTGIVLCGSQRLGGTPHGSSALNRHDGTRVLRRATVATCASVRP